MKKPKKKKFSIPGNVLEDRVGVMVVLENRKGFYYYLDDRGCVFVSNCPIEEWIKVEKNFE